MKLSKKRPWIPPRPKVYSGRPATQRLTAIECVRYWLLSLKRERERERAIYYLHFVRKRNYRNFHLYLFVKQTSNKFTEVRNIAYNIWNWYSFVRKEVRDERYTSYVLAYLCIESNIFFSCQNYTHNTFLLFKTSSEMQTNTLLARVFGQTNNFSSFFQ